MTRKQKIAKAKRLREKGLTYAAIGEALGHSNETIWGWLNPELLREKRRRSNAKRGPAKRAWEAGECPRCGGRIANIRDSELCRPCRNDENERRIKERVERFIELRKQGFTNKEIEASEGLPFNAVANALSRDARRFGLTVPPSPYRNRGKVAA